MTNINDDSNLIFPDVPALRERFFEWADKELEKSLNEERIADINVLNETFDAAFYEFLDLALAADQGGHLHSLIFRLMVCSAAYSKLAPPTENVMSSVHQMHSRLMNETKSDMSKDANNLLDKFLDERRSEWESQEKISDGLVGHYSERFRKENSALLKRMRIDKGFPKDDSWPSASTIRRRISKLSQA